MTKKVMKLIDEKVGLMECPVCGAVEPVRAFGLNKSRTTRYKRGSWQCKNGCRVE